MFKPLSFGVIILQIDNGADVHIVYADVHANPGLVLPDLDGSPYTVNDQRCE